MAPVPALSPSHTRPGSTEVAVSRGWGRRKRVTVQVCALIRQIHEGGVMGKFFPHVATYASSASGFICIIRIKLINLLEILDDGKLPFAGAVSWRKGFLQAWCLLCMTDYKACTAHSRSVILFLVGYYQ